MKNQLTEDVIVNNINLTDLNLIQLKLMSWGDYFYEDLRPFCSDSIRPAVKMATAATRGHCQPLPSLSIDLNRFNSIQFNSIQFNLNSAKLPPGGTANPLPPSLPINFQLIEIDGIQFECWRFANWLKLIELIK